MNITSFKVIIFLLTPRNMSAKLLLILCLSFLLASSVSFSVFPYIFKLAVDNYYSDVSNNFLFQYYICFYIGLYAFAKIIDNLRLSIYERFEQKNHMQLASCIFAYFESSSLAYLKERELGALNTIIEKGLNDVGRLYKEIFFLVFPVIFEVLFAYYIIFINYEFALSFSILSILSLFVLTVIVSSYITHSQYITNKQISINIGKLFIEYLLNIEIIKQYNKGDAIINKYKDLLKLNNTNSLRLTDKLALMGGLQTAIVSLGFLAVLLFSSFQVKSARMSLGDFVLINTYMLNFFNPLQIIGGAFQRIKEQVINVSFLLNVINTKETKHKNSKEKKFPRGKISIEFKNVSFSYEPNKTTLKDISFYIPPNKKVGIVGLSGSGKSTIARLLFGLYAPCSGEILINGINLNLIKVDALRDNFTAITQESFLFNNTIGYNIAFGKPEAKDFEIQMAAKKAGIDDFVSSLHEGYNTIVGDQGFKLSGGEKQRINIARALLRNTKVLILDEPTSALDYKKEKEIVSKVLKNSRNKTILMIGHRLSTLELMDEILVVHQGKIVEKGTHDYLISLRKHYYSLWKLQHSERH